MRLFLSSYHLGNAPEGFTALLGENKRAAIITNAADAYGDASKAEKLPSHIQELKNIGIEGTELDLRKYFGKPDELKKELLQYGAVWIVGGNCFLLRRAMFDSGFDKIIAPLLQENGLVYAGYSAGSVVATPTLVGIELVDQLEAVQEVYKTEPIWEGLNLVPYSIAPHYRSNHPESEAIEKVVEFFTKENMPFKALKDGQAIVIQDGKEEVVG